VLFQAWTLNTLLDKTGPYAELFANNRTMLGIYITPTIVTDISILQLLFFLSFRQFF